MLATGAGFLREVVIAYYFGASTASDALALVVYVYDTVSIFLFQGGLAYAVVPLLAGARARRDVEAERTLVAGLLTWITTAGLLTLAASLCCAETAATLFFGQREPLAAALLSRALRVSGMGLLLGAVAAYLSCVAQAHERFAAPTFGRFAWNLVAIVCVVAAPGDVKFRAALVGLVLGSGAQLVLVARAVPRASWRWRPAAAKAAAVLDALRQSSAALVGMGCGALALGLGERAILSWLSPGSVAMASYAQRSASLASVVGLSFLTVAFSRMALDVGKTDRDALARTFGVSVGLGALALAPLAGLLYAYGGAIVAMLFGRGALSADAVAITGNTLRLYALSVVPGFLYGLVVRLVFAGGRAWAGAAINGAVAVVAVTCDLVLVRWLGIGAIPVGFTVGLFAAIPLGIAVLRPLLGAGVGSWLLPALRPTVAAALVAALLAHAVSLDSLGSTHGRAGWAAASTLALGGTLYTALYLLLCGVLRVPELRAALGGLRSAHARLVGRLGRS